MKSLVTFILVSLVSAQSLAVAGSCAQLKQELKSMQKAQAALMASLVNNHETFAATLEEYAAKPAGKQMEKSAEAFRQRGLQGKKTALQLNQATAELIGRVSACF